MLQSSALRIDDVLTALNGLDASTREGMMATANAAAAGRKWVPNPGPQTDAYFCEADELFYGGQAGGGKDLSLDTPIPTPAGWATMVSLQVGDLVFDEEGATCRVVAKSEVFNKPTYRVHFSDGTDVVAGPGHEWLTKTEKERDEALKLNAEWRAKRRATRPSRSTGTKSQKFIDSLRKRNAERAAGLTSREPSAGQVRTTQELFETQLSSRGGLNHSVMAAAPLQLPDVNLSIDPYLLGLWLGDGCSSAASLTIAESEVLERATQAAALHGWTVVKWSSKYAYGISGGMKVALRALGVLDNKHVPATYLRASIPQRLALLQGLMDTDGYVDKRGQCEIQLTCKPLIDGVAELLSSLGVKYQMREGLAKLYGRTTSAKWRLKFLTELPAFRLLRKLERQKRDGFRGTHDVRYITCIEQLPAEPTQCIQVDSPSHMYLCSRAMIPTHNSDLEIGLALTEHHRSLVLRRTNREALGLVERMAEVIGDRDGWSGQHGIWRLDERTVEISGCQLEEDKQKFKGAPHDLICVGRGTPVLMGDGSFKSVETVAVGDMVATLEGTRRVLRAFRVTDRAAVSVTVAGVTQIQSASHRLFTEQGWLSSDDLCDLQTCSQSTLSRAVGKCYAAAGLIFQGCELRLLSCIDSLRQAARSALAILGLLHRQVLSVFGRQQALGTAAAASCVSFQGQQPPLLSFDRSAQLAPHLVAGEPFAGRRSIGHASCGARGALALGGSRGGYRAESHSGDARPRSLPGLLRVATDDPALFLQRGDAAQPNPIGSGADDAARTPRHSRPTRMYPHPYGKGTRSTAANLSSSSWDVVPVVVDELFDLEVEEVNHFITAGGIINKNCFDEVSDFSETQYVFIGGWNRSTKPGQRCRIVAAGNPPTRPEGLWVLKRWAAWLDPNHHNPAKPGELRWYTTGAEGEEIEVDGPGPHMIGDDLVIARSRTFIPATLNDNPDLKDSGYAATLAAMPEELRAAYRDGRFDAGLKDRAYQAIPTAWVRMAQERWTETPPQGVPMCSMGVDASGGGADPMIIAKRFGGWYDKIVRVPGKEIPIERAGAYCAGIVVSHRRDDAVIVVDLGGGYGSAMYEQLHANSLQPIGHKGAEKAFGKTLCNKFTFANVRSAVIWRFREALDPGQPGGSVVALPPSATLLADLTAPTYEPDSKQIVVESKKKVCERLGRSTDEGDAVVMAWSKGIKQENLVGGFKEYQRSRTPKVVAGRTLQSKRR